MRPPISRTLHRTIPGMLVPLALVAAAPSLRAQTASTWHEVARGDDGTRVAIDSSTVSHTRDSTFVVRTAIHFPEAMQVSGGRRVDHEVDLEELDCGGGRSRGLISGLYLDTSVVAAVPMPRTWSPVAENRRMVFDASCAWLLGSFARVPTGYALSEVDEQPELANRADVAAALSRNYPHALRDHGITGVVTVRFRVNHVGRIEVPTLSVVETSHEELSGAALRTVMAMSFRPARVQGAAVPVWVILPVSFALEGPTVESPRSANGPPADHHATGAPIEVRPRADPPPPPNRSARP